MAWAAVGVGAASLVGGLFSQGGVNDARARQEEEQRKLEIQAKNAPKYQGSAALDKYYTQSQTAANTGAEQSALYKQQMNQTNRLMGAGIAGLGSRPGGQGAVASLVQKGADLSGNAISQAYAQKEQRFGRLGQVAQQKAADDMRKFQINEQNPYETQLGLASARAQGATRDLMQSQANQSQLFNQGINFLGMGAGGLFNKYGRKSSASDIDSTT